MHLPTQMPRSDGLLEKRQERKPPRSAACKKLGSIDADARVGVARHGIRDDMILVEPEVTAWVMRGIWHEDDLRLSVRIELQVPQVVVPEIVAVHDDKRLRAEQRQRVEDTTARLERDGTFLAVV